MIYGLLEELLKAAGFLSDTLSNSQIQEVRELSSLPFLVVIIVIILYISYILGGRR